MVLGKIQQDNVIRVIKIPATEQSAEAKKYVEKGNKKGNVVITVALKKKT